MSPQAKHSLKGSEMKKLIATVAALMLGAAVLGVPGPADARVRVVVTPVCDPYGWCPPTHYRSWWTPNPWKPFNAKRYAGCTKQVVPKRVLSPALVFLVDACYLGDPW